MHQPYSIIIIVLLVLFAIYRRIRRNIGFQRLVPNRLRVRMIIFLIIGLILLVSSAAQPILYVSDAIGIILGLILAYFATSTTKFEVRKERWFYRPNAWVGGIVLALFLGRLLYAFILVYSTMGKLPQHGSGQASNPFQSGSYVKDPWTAGIIFVLIAYYAGYFLFLLRKAKQLPDAQSND